MRPGDRWAQQYGDRQERGAHHTSVWKRLQVFAQEIATEVAVEVAPDRVYVVAVVLRVVVLDEERRPLDAVVMFLPPLRLTGPREPDVLQARLATLLHALRRDVRRHYARVDLDQFHQQVGLRRRHRRPFEADWVQRIDRGAVLGQHLVGRCRL